jgi:hypothetical protein
MYEDIPVALRRLAFRRFCTFYTNGCHCEHSEAISLTMRTRLLRRYASRNDGFGGSFNCQTGDLVPLEGHHGLGRLH